MEGRQRSCFRWRRLQPACTGGLMAGSLRIPKTNAMNHSWFSSLMTDDTWDIVPLDIHWTSCSIVLKFIWAQFGLVLWFGSFVTMTTTCFQRKVYRVNPIETYWCMVKPSKKLSLLLCVLCVCRRAPSAVSQAGRAARTKLTVAELYRCDQIHCAELGHMQSTWSHKTILCSLHGRFIMQCILLW